MILKLLAVAAFLVPGAAHAQKQQWYLTALNQDSTAMIVVDQASVRRNGDVVTATVLLISIDDGEGEDEALNSRIEFDCAKHAWRALSIQKLDIDGQPMEEPVTGTSDWATISEESFFKGPEDFACKESANPDPALLVGERPPVRSGYDVLRERRAKK